MKHADCSDEIRGLEPDEIRKYVDQARALRSAYVHTLLSDAALAVRSALRKTFAARETPVGPKQELPLALGKNNGATFAK